MQDARGKLTISRWWVALEFGFEVAWIEGLATWSVRLL